MLTEDDWAPFLARHTYAILIGAAYYRNVPWFYNMFKDTFDEKGLGLVVIFCSWFSLRRHRARLGVFRIALLYSLLLSRTNRDGPPPPSKPRPGGDDLHASINSGRGVSPGATRPPPPAARIHSKGGQARGEGAVDRCDVRRA